MNLSLFSLSILELDTAVANHSHREAFSSVEVQTAKERLAKLQELTSNLNAVWKGVRWLMDVIGFARDRGCIPGFTMREILEFNSLPQRDAKLVKSSPGRGSWPGPSGNNNLGSSTLLGAEHSKSEQNLGLSSRSSRYLSTSGIDCASRKNSADSNYSQSGPKILW